MTKRSLSLPVLLITIVVGGATGAGLYFGHRFQLQRLATGLQTLAERERSASNWMKAAEYFDRYLRLQPGDAKTEVDLALTYAKAVESLPQKQRAVQLHYRALASAPKESELEVRRGLTDLLLEVGRLTEAEKEARKVLAELPDDPPAQRVLALALVGQLAQGALDEKKYEELALVQTVERARRLNPADVRLATVVAELYRSFPQPVMAEFPQLTEPKRHERADESLNQLVRENPESADAYLARYRYRARLGMSDWQTDLDKALQLAPKDSDVLLAAGANAQAQAERLKATAGEPQLVAELFEQAKGHYQQLTEKPPTERVPQAFLGLGDAWLGLGKSDEAIAAWKDGINQFSQPTVQVALQSRIAEALLRSNQLSECGTALDAVDEILARLGGSVSQEERLNLSRSQDFRRATWHAQRGEVATAVQLLRDVIAKQPRLRADPELSIRAWLLLGSLYGSAGEWFDAARAYEQAADLRVGLQSASLAASNAWLLAGRADKAATRADEAVAASATLEAWSAIALAQFQWQLQQPPERRDWFRFEEALAALEKAKPQLREGTPWRIDILQADYAMVQAKEAKAADGGKGTAAAILKQAELAYADRPEFWLQVCFAYQSLKHEDDADRALARFQELGGGATEHALAKARLIAGRDDYEAAVKVLDDAGQNVSGNDKKRLRGELLRLALANKDLLRARAMLVEELNRQPQSVPLLRKLAEIDLERGELAAVEQWEKRLLALGSAGEPYARFFHASRLYRSTQDNSASAVAEALRALEQVVLLRPNWPEALALKGLTELRLGRHEAAAEDLERAVQMGERRIVVLEQLIALLDRLGRTDDIQRYLARLEADLPLSQRLAEYAVASEMRQERPEQAVEIARRRVEQRSDDPLAHLWLGRLLMITGDVPGAEVAFRRAIELAPTDARTWSALLALHLRAKDKAKVEAIVIELANNQNLDSVNRSLLLAQAHESLGDRVSAERSYIEAAAGATDNVAALVRSAQFFMQTDMRKAEELLQRAIELEPKSAGIRRLLAIVLAAQGGEKQNQATALLQATDQAGAVATEDLRLRALLQSEQGGVENLQSAAKLLEDVIARGKPASAVDQLVVAQVYERLSRLTGETEAKRQHLAAAKRHLVQLAERESPDPAHLAVLVQFLHRAEEKAEASHWLEQLEGAIERKSPDSPESIALVVRMQALLGELDRSERWLQTLERVDSDPLRPLALRAQVLAKQNPQADIEAHIDPRAKTLLAAAKTDEKRLAIERGVAELYSVLNRHAAAERWFRRLHATDPNQFVGVARSLVRQGRAAEAIAVCEQAAKIDPGVQPALTLASVLVEGECSPEEAARAMPLLKEALAKHAADPRLLYAVALVHVIRGDSAASIPLLRDVLERAPRNVPALNNLALMLAEVPSEREEAVRLIDRAIEIAGQEAALLDTKGAILVYSGQSAAAVPLLEAATADPNADPRHHFHLALAYRDQGNWSGAKSHLQKALDRKLQEQVLTTTDEKLLADLRSAIPVTP